MRLKEIQPLKPLQKRFSKGRKKLGKMLENVGKELDVSWGFRAFAVIDST